MHRSSLRRSPWYLQRLTSFSEFIFDETHCNTLKYHYLMKDGKMECFLLLQAFHTISLLINSISVNIDILCLHLGMQLKLKPTKSWKTQLYSHWSNLLTCDKCFQWFYAGRAINSPKEVNLHWLQILAYIREFAEVRMLYSLKIGVSKVLDRDSGGFITVQVQE